MWLMRLRKRTRMADLVVGSLVTVEGEVRSENRVAIPGAGVSCVYYTLLQEVLKSGSRGRGRPLWFVEKLEAKCFAFTVSDGTGVVEIREPGESIRVENGHHQAGYAQKKRNRRYAADFIRTGDRLLIRGQVKGTEQTKEGPLFILVAPPKKALSILVTRRVLSEKP